MKKKKLTYGIAIVVLVIIGLFVVMKAGGKAVSVSLNTEKIGRADISNTVTATGTLEASVTVEVGTQVSGKINKLYADFNDNVKKGQLLAVLDTAALKSSLESAKATLDLAQAEYDYQKSLYDRNKQLIEKKLIAQTDFDETAYNYKSAKANLKSATAKYNSAKTDLSYAYIYSPIDGVVLERVVEEGETVAASYETPELFTIANDLTQMEIEADVDEADIGQLVLGQRVDFTVDAFPDEVFEGEVIEIQLMPTEESNVITYTVVINAPNEEKILMPGMTASAIFYVTEKKKILVVPNEALEFQPNMSLVEAYQKANPEVTFQFPEMGDEKGHTQPEGDEATADMPAPPSEGEDMQAPPELPETQKIVWIKKDNTISPKMIEVGETDEINYELISGLEEGDEIVVSMKSSKPQAQDEEAGSQSSPFMPKPPGGNKK